MNLRSILLLVLVPTVTASAQVTLPKVLSSHMVIQRNLPVHVWGMAAPGEEVSASFRGETRSTKAGPLGRWSVYLSPGEAGGPFALTVTGTPAAGGAAGQGNAVPANTITLDDILVGDIWVASGQSNMEFAMNQAATAAQDLPHADNPHIRLLMIKRKAVDTPQDDADTEGWTSSTPDTARDFSAVAWYFARDIENREHVPVGVIDSTWGGTPAEAWTSMAALGADAALAPSFVAWGKMTEEQSDADLKLKMRQREADAAKAAGKPVPPAPWVPAIDSWGPGMLYNGMIAPLTPLPIRGVIWYQGESNADQGRAPLYSRVFRTMIEDWRREWGVGDFPFLFVQIANYKAAASSDWPTLRDQQLKTLALRNTGMAVTIDIGNPDNIHPTDKVDVGLRLALAARVLAYGENVEDFGPVFRQATPEGSSIRAWFDHAKNLMAKGGAVTSVEVAGVDGKFFPADAKVDGSTVVASSPSVEAPVFIRYGWADSPQCNLFNGDGLPASPFTSKE